MSDQNKAGDMIFKAGDGGPGGPGGALHIGPGTYKAGDAIQQKQEINANQLVDFLIPVINAHPNLTPEKKSSLIDKLKNGLGTIADIASLSKLVFDVFSS